MNTFALLCVLPSIFSLAINVLNKKFLGEFKEAICGNHQVLFRSNVLLLHEVHSRRRYPLHLKKRKSEREKRSLGKNVLNEYQRRSALVIIKESCLLKKNSIIESRRVEKYSFSNGDKNYYTKRFRASLSKNFDTTALRALSNYFSDQNQKEYIERDKIIFQYSKTRRSTFYTVSMKLPKTIVRRETVF